MAEAASKAIASLDAAGVAAYMCSGRCRTVSILTGAGVSVAAGIPDFRSPGGMYATLRPERLTATAQHIRWMRDNPAAVVSWDVFRHNQLP